jgi:AraC-like DNA-binding protein
VLRTQPGDGCFRHRHLYDELCLFSGSSCTAIHAGREVTVHGDTLFLFRRGEEHGYFNAPGDRPTLWVVHYRVDDGLLDECPALQAADPARRIWRLDGTPLHRWQDLFRRMLAEHAGQRPGSASAASAWLRLLLVSVARRCGSGPAAATAEAAGIADAEVARLFDLIQSHQGDPARLVGTLHRQAANYDALRHRFRRIYGLTPAELVRKNRLMRAQHLLIETELAVGAIAERLGYARSHEFTRHFHQTVGLTPTAFRRREAWSLEAAQSASS